VHPLAEHLDTSGKSHAAAIQPNDLAALHTVRLKVWSACILPLLLLYMQVLPAAAASAGLVTTDIIQQV
jgi:hypothetical protein